jgi:catechol 2,3-dioxygenase-like lactoylglutathione lyase family enzyme
MFDHLSLGVANLEDAARFYDACLSPLGVVRLWTKARAVGYGPRDFAGAEEPFAIIQSGPGTYAPAPGFHLAFAAPSREAVAAFHAAALLAGGTDEGAPGTREHYGPGYYAAFVRDLDGNRIEAVRHERV